MTKLIQKDWWLAAGTRAIKTFFQAFVAVIATSAAIEEVNWIAAASAAGLAAIVSLGTSLAGLPETSKESAEELSNGLEEGEDEQF